MMDVSTQLEQVERRFQQEKLFAQACTLFGGLAMLVAAIGLFGLMSYTVSRRTNEIGIRMALGAQRGDVMRQVLRESMILVAVGVAIGVAAAFGTGRFLSTMLFGLAPNDVRDDRHGDTADDCRLRTRRLPAGASRLACRSHGCAQVRLKRATRMTRAGQRGNEHPRCPAVLLPTFL